MYQAGEGRAQGSTGRSSRGVRLSGRNMLAEMRLVTTDTRDYGEVRGVYQTGVSLSQAVAR